MTTRSDTLRFDLDDPEFQRDPYPFYRRFRAQPGLVRGGPGQWVVTRHAEVAPLLRDPRLGREFPVEYQQLSVGPGPAAEYLARIVIDRDPEEHTRLRKLITRAITPQLVRDLKEPVGVTVDGLLARARDEGRLDAYADLAQPLPVAVMGDLFGIPAADRPDIERWSIALAKAFAVFIPEHDRRRAHESVVRLRRYLAELVAERVRRPGVDLVSRMIAAAGPGLDREEIVDNALFVYYAGYETTTNLLATGCAALARHPEQTARLRADPALLPTAIEEFLRFDAPIHTTTRLVREPLWVGGQKVRAGRVLVLALAAANRDEERFAAPDALDVGRRPNPHLSFGGGIHHCLGAMMARSEASVVFGRLLAAFKEFTVDGELVWRPAGGGFRFPYCAYEAIPLRVTPV